MWRLRILLFVYERMFLFWIKVVIGGFIVGMKVEICSYFKSIFWFTLLFIVDKFKVEIRRGYLYNDIVSKFGILLDR